MGLLEPRLSFALVVFVLSPDGELDTIGGEPVSARELGMVHGGASAGDVGAALLRGTPWEPVRGVTTARLRPLMPRVSRRGEVVVPMWTSGRFPAGGVWDLSSRFGGPLHGRALERLAELLGDPSLVAEAQVEFRRALASDPLSHQMVGEGVRLRSLALDGLEEIRTQEIRAQEIRAQELSARGMRGFAPSDGRPPLPPLLALLPAEFTIEQLRVAVRRVARIDEEELESASNFRRRIAEFVEARVLVEVGDVEDAKQKGRPAKLYRFDAERWHGWLEGKVGQFSARELFQARRQRGVGDEHAEYAFRPLHRPMPAERGAPPESSGNRAPPRIESREVPPGAAEAAAQFSAQPRRKPVGAEGARIPASEVPSRATADNDERVARLEAMVKHLLSRFEAMSLPAAPQSPAATDSTRTSPPSPPSQPS